MTLLHPTAVCPQFVIRIEFALMKTDHSLYCADGNKYVNEPERLAFLAAVATAEEAIRTFAETLVYTGCRGSEALAVRVTDVNIDSLP